MNAGPTFEWDEAKNLENQVKHGVTFEDAQYAFIDPQRVIYIDLEHSTSDETRYFCLGMIDNRVCAVRFTYRANRVRIFGAGYWRKERRIYEQRNRKP